MNILTKRIFYLGRRSLLTKANEQPQFYKWNTPTSFADHLLSTDLLESEESDTDEIMCTHSRVHSIPALRQARFKSVARLCLRQNSIQHIEGLACVAGTLRELDFYDNLIS